MLCFNEITAFLIMTVSQKNFNWMSQKIKENEFTMIQISEFYL